MFMIILWGACRKKGFMRSGLTCQVDFSVAMGRDNKIAIVCLCDFANVSATAKRLLFTDKEMDLGAEGP
jgi:hypothetical protein